jgi:spore coat protein U-like protein
MSNKKLLALATGAALLAGAQGASAGLTGASTANYDITLTASCSLGVTGKSFGPFPVESADLIDVAAGTVDVTCSAGAPYVILFNGGNYQDPAGRNMMDSSGLNFMNYKLYNAADTTIEVGDANSLDASYASDYPYNGISGTGTGAAQQYNLRADVLISSSPVIGSYYDAVSVTVSF